MFNVNKLAYLFYATRDGASYKASAPLMDNCSRRGALPLCWLSHKSHKVAYLSPQFSHEFVPFYLFLYIHSLLRNMAAVFYFLAGLLLICLDTFLCRRLFYVGCFYSIPAFFRRFYSYCLRSKLGVFRALFQSGSLTYCALRTQEFFLCFLCNTFYSKICTAFGALRKKIRLSLPSIFDISSFKADYNLCV